MDERLEGLTGDNGITNCGNAQNCLEVCPMSIPLPRAIYESNRDITVNGILGWLKK
jgi:succinate dehydrogenase / fumarate reductase iron-sulfur subunit